MKALFIVERDFLSKHVGVARVILHYAEGLKAEGVQVDFGFPQGGEIILGRLAQKPYEGEGELIDLSIPLPWYASEGQVSTLTGPITGNTARYSVSWLKEKAKLEEYQANLITAPWVCALGLPPLPNVLGIVYDLVPNLAAAGCIRLNYWTGLIDFAHEHDIGFRYYLANAERILCISEATRQDFLRAYETASRMADGIWVDIPYTYKTKCNTYQGFSSGEKESGEPNVLLVNALDWRKNLKGIEAVLKKAAMKKSFKLLIVGKERIPMPDVEHFFSSLEEVGIRIMWWRHAGDEVLYTCYRNASVLLFPSLYEGLGLPILEAQNMGVPVITSNISSCPDINLNPTLCFDPSDIDGMAGALKRCLVGDEAVASGEILQNLLFHRLKSQKSFAQLLIPAV